MTKEHNDWLIIANGEPFNQETLNQLAKNKTVIALDGALSTCVNANIMPDIVIGDFDSIDTQLIDKIKKSSNTQFLLQSDQNSTDLQKALTYLQQQQAQHITICHATGWRLDHTLYNLRLLKRFHNAFDSLVLVTATERVFYVQDQLVTLHSNEKQPVALLAFTEAHVTSQGLEYDMDHYPLRFGEQESTSNAITSRSASINVQGCALVIIGQRVTHSLS